MSEDKFGYGVSFSDITKGMSIKECTFQVLNLDTGRGAVILTLMRGDACLAWCGRGGLVQLALGGRTKALMEIGICLMG